MFDVTSTARDFERDLNDLARRQLPFALALAMNDTAARLLRLNRTRMARVFDRPTRWTMNAFHFVRARKARPVATIKRKDGARSRHYLEVQDEGGTRPLGGWERQLDARLPYAGRVGYVVPTKHMRRDRHGNVSRAEMQRVLSNVQAQTNASANTTEGSRKRSRRSVAYFVPRPGSKLSPGVYRRRDKDLAKVFAFDAKAPRYSARLDFDRTMERGALRLMPPALYKALRRALASAR
jgi:hypothetical protein